MREIKSPIKVNPNNEQTLFLAGSIENGKADNWQERVPPMLRTKNGIIFNPRQENWELKSELNINNSDFKEQVEWELEHLNKATKVIFYFDPATKSPVALLELGLIGSSSPEKCVVVCQEPFYRKGNIDIVCEIYGIKQCNTLEEAVRYLDFE